MRVCKDESQSTSSAPSELGSEPGVSGQRNFASNASSGTHSNSVDNGLAQVSSSFNRRAIGLKGGNVAKSRKLNKLLQRVQQNHFLLEAGTPSSAAAAAAAAADAGCSSATSEFTVVVVVVKSHCDTTLSVTQSLTFTHIYIHIYTYGLCVFS